MERRKRPKGKVQMTKVLKTNYLCALKAKTKKKPKCFEE